MAGGAELALVEHVALLDQARFEIHVACTGTVPDLLRQFDAAGATVHVMEMPKLRGARPSDLVGFARSIHALRKILHDAGIDCVVSNTTRASYIASMAVLGTGVPLLWWVRDFFYPRRIFRLTRSIPRRVVYVSEALRRFYGDQAAADAVVWPVASALYRELSELRPGEVAEARASYGLSNSVIVVGFMGRLVEEKGAADVIDAVDALRREFPEVRLLVVGSGQGQANNAEPGLHRRVEERGLSSVVRFAGFQSAQALHYALFDLFVMATRDFEAYPTSVVQAMMAGKPVVASDVGGNPEIVEHERTGLLYPAGNVAALTAAIRRLLVDSPLRQRLADAGRDRVLKENRGEQLAAVAESLYETVTRG